LVSLLQELNKILGKSLTTHPLGSASFISVSVNAAILQIVGSVLKLIATCAGVSDLPFDREGSDRA